MTFREYYADQFRRLPECLRLVANANIPPWKKCLAFLNSASLLLFPRAMYVMYLYDTGKMKIDKRYKKEEKQ